MQTHEARQLLVVDDEVKLTAALCDTLKKRGYGMTGVNSGHEGLQALKDRIFDLILVDLMMPGMDGISFLKAALEIDPYLMGIIMTGHGTVQTAVEAMKFGAFDYILKPFKLKVLLPILDRAMEMRRLRTENLQMCEALTIYQLGLTVSQTLDMDTLLNKIADAALQQLDADEVSITLAADREEGRRTHITATLRRDEDRISEIRVVPAGDASDWTALLGSADTLDGRPGDTRFDPAYSRSDTSASVSVPMLAGGKLVGVLNARSRHMQPPTLGQIKGLKFLASTAAAGLENVNLYTQVRQAEEKYRRIFENAVEGIFQSTADGRFLTASPGLARMLGYASPEELIDSITDMGTRLFVEPDRYSEFCRATELGGNTSGFECQVYRKDKSTIWISIKARCVRNADGMLVCFEGLIEDISERKRAQDELRHLSARLLNAHEEERKRIARELHDSLGSSLTSIKILLESARIQLEHEGDVDPEVFDNTISWTQHAIDEARRMMSDLRPSILDDLGIVATINWLLRQYRVVHPGIEVEKGIGIEEGDIPEPLKIVIFRIIQEAFHNVLKHSNANLVRLCLSKTESSIELAISDNGVGFNVRSVSRNKEGPGGLGIASMRERAGLSGGTCSIDSTAGRGTTVRVAWPRA